MKYLLFIVLLAGCSVNKDVHDMNDRLGYMQKDLDSTALELKQTNEELSKITMLTDEVYSFINRLHKYDIIDDQGVVDLNKTNDDQLQEVSVTAQKIADDSENTPLNLPPIQVKEIDKNTAPQKTSLLQKIKENLEKIFKHDQNGI